MSATIIALPHAGRSPRAPVDTSRCALVIPFPGSSTADLIANLERLLNVYRAHKTVRNSDNLTRE